MKLKNITLLGLMLCLLQFVVPVYGQNKKAELTNEKKKLEQEIAQQRALLKKTQKNKNASLREIQLISSQVKKQEKLIATINGEINCIEGEIEANSREITKLENRLEVLKKDYAQSVYITYKYRHVLNKASFIISAGSIGEAVRRIRYLQEYSSVLKRDVRHIQETRQTLHKKEEDLQLSKHNKQQLLQDGNRKKQQLAQQQKEKNQIVSKLKKQEGQIQKEINKKIQRQKAVNAAINKIISEEIAKSNKKAASTSTSAKPAANATPAHLTLTPTESALASDFESNKGKLPWPVEKGSIVTPFGPYSHAEISSIQIPNDGINIVTEKGGKVRAVFNGTVSGVASIGESKVVIIRHGNYLSVYSNLGSVYVQKGSKVTTKQTIGTVYSESGENSAELHFEIRKESTPLNPGLWIKR
ncbi:MAG: peptidoglycan DD-metalloendopeptidase family protein [Bacteroidales bacterium]|nr:peptidoglycan DD-metalloendopeptidase family protein [Bacteroidales bacterium]